MISWCSYLKLSMTVACSMLLIGGASAEGRPPSLPAGARYVAMGSSFAAGPGIPERVEGSPARCARSTNNYAHLLARRLDLQLVDVSCSGATTAHILGPWGDLPPQIAALTADTRLVTVTIGGNDLAYITTLGTASCRSFAAPPAFLALDKCPSMPVLSEEKLQALDASLRRIVAEVRIRAPSARLVFVDYLTVLPPRGSCAATPMSAQQADAGRALAKRLSSLTQRIASDEHVDLLRASSLSEKHSACSRKPWITGFPLTGQAHFVPYHPRGEGMAAVATALVARLRR